MKDYRSLYDACKQQAQIWKQEARAANHTIGQIYQVVTGAKGEPGNWNGAEPVRQLIAERDALREALEAVQPVGRAVMSHHMSEPWVNWMPIETAPKDGRFVLLFVPNSQLETGPVTIGGYWKAEGRARDGRFKNGEWARADFRGWLGTDADYSASWCDPSHWALMPAPPAV